jgi:hypothetical protein
VKIASQAWYKFSDRRPADKLLNKVLGKAH